MLSLNDHCVTPRPTSSPSALPTGSHTGVCTLSPHSSVVPNLTSTAPSDEEETCQRKRQGRGPRPRVGCREESRQVLYCL